MGDDHKLRAGAGMQDHRGQRLDQIVMQACLRLVQGDEGGVPV